MKGIADTALKNANAGEHLRTSRREGSTLLLSQQRCQSYYQKIGSSSDPELTLKTVIYEGAGIATPVSRFLHSTTSDEETLNRSDRRRASSTNPWWQRPRRHPRDRNGAPPSGSHLGPCARLHADRHNKAVCRVAVCSLCSTLQFKSLLLRGSPCKGLDDASRLAAYVVRNYLLRRQIALEHQSDTFGIAATAP